ncbi:hypothetical protein BAUCODRAFT_68328 [Baudoinia panamericana UAMH 10762]|uniref:KOW domain-containing protein n=1 Tax=Baudoinia panamericana (strain UAMH 10762) TaxID=717646 RepID=M2MLN7_BAUPA|nr:uncharacterized protein BAUCODRAFT_68328 [Baudoinia panamericana UAMH 10762]EMC97566.1 hypothetical protein BAUCODRAFT_68328 [Baudoinia panamericana UAMH 10762]
MRNRLVKVYGESIRQARINRQVDWDTGALAPRRDAGENATGYGALGIQNLNMAELPNKHQVKRSLIVEGDRVAVIRGREKGKIGSVTQYSKESNSVKIKGVNVVDVVVPEYLTREQNLSSDTVQPVSRNIPIEDVRLVYPLPDPETGIPRDVMIDRLIRIKNVGRVIPGTNTVIPWPEKLQEEDVDHPYDTLRINVEEQTFRPILLYHPMPETVLDELRGKYSKFRKRHDREYIEKLELEDAKVEKRRELMKGMRTPLQELAAMRQQQKQAELKKELTEEQLARIGAVIAAEQAKALGRVQGVPGAER